MQYTKQVCVCMHDVSKHTCTHAARHCLTEAHSHVRLSFGLSPHQGRSVHYSAVVSGIKLLQTLLQTASPAVRLPQAAPRLTHTLQQLLR